MTDLDCKQTEKLIPQFLKDELDNRTEKKFLNHVDGCSSCLEELSIQFLVTTGMQRLENGDTFDLNRELRMRIDTEKRHLHILSSLQHGLYATEAMAILAALAGLVLMFRPGEGTSVLMTVLGITLLAEGILNFSTMITAVKIIRHQQPDTDTVEVHDFRDCP